jgi:hypothetical protein
VVHKKILHQARASLSSWLMIRRQKKTSVKKKEGKLDKRRLVSARNRSWLAGKAGVSMGGPQVRRVMHAHAQESRQNI